MWNHPHIVQSLWEGLMVGACLVDRAGMLTHMNLAGSRLLGWGAACPTHVPCHDLLGCLVSSDTSDVPICPLDYLRDQPLVWRRRTRLRNRQGGWCWVELKGLAILELEVSGFLLMFRDLSDELQWEHTMNRLASIPQESPFPVIEVSAEGHLLYANPSMLKLMEEARIGPGGFSTALPEGFPELATRCLAVGDLADHIEVNVGNKQYSWILSPHPELNLLRGYGMDVTEPKRAAEELSAFADTLEAKNRELDQALVKAESATRAKATFLAVMSHEIRTPLNGVIGMAELLLQSSLNAEQQECTNIIRQSGERLLAIINDILDFSKIESGQLALEHIGFNPTHLVEETVDLFSERAHRKGLDIAAYVHPEVPPHLSGDPHRLRQIISNYISNALKFTAAGSVLVRASLTEAPVGGAEESTSGPSESAGESDHEPMVWVRFSVEDTGPGMTEEVQHKIFQVFTQADSSMSRKFGGSGLGLAICKQLAELMHGSVGLTSQPDHGSVFWCDIPFSVPRVPAPSAHYLPSIRGKEIWVLVPSPSSSWVIGQLLNEVGATVVRLQDIQEVEAVLAQRSSDMSGVAGFIVEGYLEEGTIRSWLEATGDIFPPSLKKWGLKPFWLHNGDEEKVNTMDGMIALPIHREQFYRCVSGHLETWCSREASADAEIAHVPSQTVTGPAAGSSDHKRPGPSVLVVEDNPVNQKVCADMLAKLGCRVTTVATGQEALQVVQKKEVDCIFMDWELPGLDGLSTTRAIREMERAGQRAGMMASSFPSRPADPPAVFHVPIIGMTAHVFPAHEQECYRSGMDACLFKPVRLQDFSTMLQRWIPRFYVDSQSVPSPAANNTDLHQTVHPTTSPEYPAANHAPAVSCAEQVLYDVPAAIDRLEGDTELLFSLYGIFNEVTPGLIHGLELSAHAHDRKNFQKQAHQLKGSLSAVHALKGAEMAAKLEALADGASTTSLLAVLQDFTAYLHDLMTLFRRLISERAGE